MKKIFLTLLLLIVNFLSLKNIDISKTQAYNPSFNFNYTCDDIDIKKTHSAQCPTIIIASTKDGLYSYTRSYCTSIKNNKLYIDFSTTLTIYDKDVLRYLTKYNDLNQFVLATDATIKTFNEYEKIYLINKIYPYKGFFYYKKTSSFKNIVINYEDQNPKIITDSDINSNYIGYFKLFANAHRTITRCFKQ